MTVAAQQEPPRRRRIRPTPLIGLTVVWVLLWGTLSWANVLSGMVLAATVLIVFPLPPLLIDVHIRPLALVTLIARFLADLVVASVKVAAQAVGVVSMEGSSVIVIPLHCTDLLAQTMIAEMVSLVPGTVVVELDSEAAWMALHVLGANTAERADAARADVRALERRVLRALRLDSVPNPDEHASRGTDPSSSGRGW